jgi:hypothetical protein
MNKKTVLFLFSMLSVSILSISPAYASKGNNKLDYVGTFRLASFDMTMRFVPAPPPDANVVFVTLTNAVTETFTLEIGGVTYEPNFDVEMLLVRNLDQDFRLVRTTEIYTFDGVVGSLVVSVTGRTNNYGNPEQMDIVNVVGHGTGYFEGVKISAKGYSPLGDTSLKIHEGTIMGWTGLPA